MGELVIITGTGTNIGKTHLSVALTHALRSLGLRAFAYKPIESGSDAPLGPDQCALLEASGVALGTPGVGPMPAKIPDAQPVPSYTFRAALSPHRAAKLDHDHVDMARVADTARRQKALHDVTLIELPGGLFTPLDSERTNADLVRAIQMLTAVHIVVVAPNRLGVLHDVLCIQSAALLCGTLPSHIALINQAIPDASSPTNALDLTKRLSCTVHTIANAPWPALAHDPAVLALATAVSRPDATAL